MSLDFESLTCTLEHPVNCILTDVAKLSQRDQRIVLLSILYAVDAFDYDVSLESVVDMIRRGFCLTLDKDDELFKHAQSILNERDSLDDQLKPLLTNWRFERLGVSTRLILRMSYWEILNTQTAPIVVINEAIELAKLFAEKDAYKFINGVLDEALKRRTAAKELL